MTADPDRVYARAAELGALVVHDLTDQTDYPSRDFTIADPTETIGRSRRSPGRRRPTPVET